MKFKDIKDGEYFKVKSYGLNSPIFRKIESYHERNCTHEKDGELTWCGTEIDVIKCNRDGIKIKEFIDPEHLENLEYFSNGDLVWQKIPENGEQNFYYLIVKGRSPVIVLRERINKEAVFYKCDKEGNEI